MDVLDYKVGDIVSSIIGVSGDRYRVLKFSLDGSDALISRIRGTSIGDGFWSRSGFLLLDAEMTNKERQDREDKRLWPHTCNFCGAPAQRMFSTVDCSKDCKALKQKK